MDLEGDNRSPLLELDRPPQSCSQTSHDQSSESPKAISSQNSANLLNAEPKRMDNDGKKHSTHWIRLWWTDLAALVISIGFLIAIFAVLISIHNTKLSHWTLPFNMQPTTLIATLISLSKLFLLVVVAEGLSQLKWVYFEQQPQKLQEFEHFDSASRGALGAVRFLYSVRWRAIAASLGALITILALAMEPFAQQSVSFYEQQHSDRETIASLPIARSYDTNAIQLGDEGVGDIPTEAKSHYAPLLGAMLEGIFTTKRNIVHPKCHTSTCTWDEYETLGICSSCQNVTLQLKTQCGIRNNTVSSYCEYTTPNRAKLHAACQRDSMFTHAPATVWDSSTTYSYDLFAIPPHIITIASISLPKDWSNDFPCYDLKTRKVLIPIPDATECTLSWCTKTYSSRVINGTLIERLVRTDKLMSPKAQGCRAETYPLLAWNIGKNVSSQSDYESMVLLYGLFKVRQRPITSTDLCSLDWRSQDDSLPAFWVNVQDVGNIQYLASNLFSHSFMDGEDMSGQMSFLGQMLYTSNGANLSDDVDAMAQSLTNYIRQGPNSTEHIGTALVVETYIHANWPWLVYPTGLVLLAALFLIGVIIFSSEKNQAVWKSSTLAILFHGLESYDDETDTRTASEMEHTARDMLAQLSKGKNGTLKLVRQ